ncbi:hypothetical protein NA56DRAFT_32278 [Hyaloscypha hepaticicola]|uniref:Uncharacterized protein n=1 Tax=Hyaloscypha hepaticicola TaxID=2082293 RepID=A0A2J6QDD8_9HELO|nr:hypothetical protein NA56DRAFT_32278 [Hyaloscypha hepaticicola]
MKNDNKKKPDDKNFHPIPQSAKQSKAPPILSTPLPLFQFQRLTLFFQLTYPNLTVPQYPPPPLHHIPPKTAGLSPFSNFKRTTQNPLYMHLHPHRSPIYPACSLPLNPVAFQTSNGKKLKAPSPNHDINFLPLPFYTP